MLHSIYMKKILVTGSAGFIGCAVAKRLLDEGNVVVGVDCVNDYYDLGLKEKRHEQILDNPQYFFYHVDITDHNALEKISQEHPDIEAIIHLAAQAGVRHSLKNPRAYIASNVLGTTNIFEFAKKAQIQKVLFASSSSVYGNSKEPSFNEGLRVDHPVSLYAATKKACELIAHSYTHLYGMTTIGLRFFTVYGPWGRPDMAPFIFAHKILSGETISIFGDGSFSRSFTYIDDVVEGITRLLDADVSGHELFNIGGASERTVNDLITVLENKLGVVGEKEYQGVQPGDVPKTSADVSKLTNVINYTPTTTLEEGVEKMADWCLENKEWFLSVEL